MKTIQSLLFICIFVLSACSAPALVPTVELTVPPASTPLPTLSASSTPLPVSPETEMPPNFSPILYGRKFDKTAFLLLGGVAGDVWLAPQAAVARFAGAAKYAIYTFPNGTSEIHGNAPEFSPPCQNYFVGTDSTIDGAGMLGVGEGWQVLQRDIQQLSSGNQIYEQAVKDWLRSEGITKPQIDILNVFRVDIEGDGIDEIFISASHLDESQHTTKAGDYSVVLMRKVAGNDVVTLPVVGDVYHSDQPEITFPLTYSLGNFVDLNQDGKLEVIVDVQKWEGFGSIVYQIDNQDIIETLRAVC